MVGVFRDGLSFGGACDGYHLGSVGLGYLHGVYPHAAACALTGERPTRQELTAVVLVLAAVGLMAYQSLSSALFPLLAGLASGALYGLYIAAVWGLLLFGQAPTPLHSLRTSL
jgi:hypothetical protein